MMEMVGGIISIVIGVIMLIIGGAVLNSITAGSAIGNCETQDYDGDGTGGLTADKATQAYKQCAQTRDSGYTVLNIMAVMLIIGGVLVSVRSFGSG